MITLSNGLIELSISPIGAELQSIRRISSNHEYLWQGDATYWDRRSPILFPITGKVWNNMARFLGSEHTLTQHGFARDMVFDKVVDEDRHVALVTRSNEQTRALYPYDFELRIDYTLLRNVITVTWTITNTGTDNMPFQIGGHPGFNLPRYNDADECHGFLTCNADSPLLSTPVPGGFCDGEPEEIAIPDDGMLPLTNTTFLRDTILECTGRLQRITIHDKNGKPYVTLRHEMPVTAIWSPCGGRAPFVCIEPWWGRCDDAGFEGDFTRKPYVQEVAAGHVWQDEYKIIIE